MSSSKFKIGKKYRPKNPEKYIQGIWMYVGNNIMQMVMPDNQSSAPHGYWWYVTEVINNEGFYLLQNKKDHLPEWF